MWLYTKKKKKRKHGIRLNTDGGLGETRTDRHTARGQSHSIVIYAMLKAASGTQISKSDEKDGRAPQPAGRRACADVRGADCGAHARVEPRGRSSPLSPSTTHSAQLSTGPTEPTSCARAATRTRDGHVPAALAPTRAFLLLRTSPPCVLSVSRTD